MKGKQTMFNTKAVQDQLQSLKTADIAALRAQQKSNFVLNYVRNELIKKAFDVDHKMNKPATVEFNMTTASICVPAITLLTKEGNYPALLKKTTMEFKDGTVALTYNINTAGISEDYRERLNASLNIAIEV